jgi:hypothetical protein
VKDNGRRTPTRSIARMVPVRSLDIDGISMVVNTPWGTVPVIDEVAVPWSSITDNSDNVLIFTASKHFRVNPVDEPLCFITRKHGSSSDKSNHLAPAYL